MIGEEKAALLQPQSSPIMDESATTARPARLARARVAFTEWTQHWSGRHGEPGDPQGPARRRCRLIAIKATAIGTRSASVTAASATSTAPAPFALGQVGRLVEHELGLSHPARSGNGDGSVTAEEAAELLAVVVAARHRTDGTGDGPKRPRCRPPGTPQPPWPPRCGPRRPERISGVAVRSRRGSSPRGGGGVRCDGVLTRGQPASRASSSSCRYSSASLTASALRGATVNSSSACPVTAPTLRPRSARPASSRSRNASRSPGPSTARKEPGAATGGTLNGAVGRRRRGRSTYRGGNLTTAAPSTYRVTGPPTDPNDHTASLVVGSGSTSGWIGGTRPPARPPGPASPRVAVRQTRRRHVRRTTAAAHR